MSSPPGPPGTSTLSSSGVFSELSGSSPLLLLSGISPPGTSGFPPGGAAGGCVPGLVPPPSGFVPPVLGLLPKGSLSCASIKTENAIILTTKFIIMKYAFI